MRPRPFARLSSLCFPDSLKAARGPYIGRGKDYRSKRVGMPVGLPTFSLPSLYPRRHSRDKMIQALSRFSRTASDRKLGVGPGNEATIAIQSALSATCT